MRDAAAQSNPDPDETRPDSSPVASSTRLTSIDALRGFDMFWIIGGGTMVAAVAGVWDNSVTRTVREQLQHVEWEGFHFEDLIYPLFLFLIGVVLPFSFARRKEQGQSRSRLYLHILTRSLLLVLLGSIPGGILRFTHWPFMGGVLQRLLIAGAGAIWLFAPSIPWIGRLPGDITVEGKGVRFFFPVATCLVLSLLLTVIMWLVRFFSR